MAAPRGGGAVADPRGVGVRRGGAVVAGAVVARGWGRGWSPVVSLLGGVDARRVVMVVVMVVVVETAGRGATGDGPGVQPPDPDVKAGEAGRYDDQIQCEKHRVHEAPAVDEEKRTGSGTVLFRFGCCVVRV